MNDTTNLSLGAYTGNYTLLVNGIGAAVEDSIPPYVKIYSPTAANYDSGTIPFTFTITDNDEVDSCWYTLNGARTSLPSCDASYILSLSGGSYSLILYANDTTGNIGSDGVSFTVGGGGGGGGGGPTSGGSNTGGISGIPYVQPTVPPIIPPSISFTTSVENIYLINDYPAGARAPFILRSDFPLYNVTCRATGDFAPWTSILLSSATVSADAPLHGEIYLDISSPRVLTYDGSTEGLLQCVAKYDNQLQLSATSNLYLVLRIPRLNISHVPRYFPIILPKPLLNVSAAPLRLNMGFNGTVEVNVTNTGTAPAVNLTMDIRGPAGSWMSVEKMPEIIEPGETVRIPIRVNPPVSTLPGQYPVTLNVYEFGVWMGDARIDLNISNETVVPPVKEPVKCGIPYGTNLLDVSSYSNPLLLVLSVLNLLLIWSTIGSLLKGVMYNAARDVLARRLVAAAILPLLYLVLGFAVDSCLANNVALLSLIVLVIARLFIQFNTPKLPKP
jgi:hypothetical protein